MIGFPLNIEASIFGLADRKLELPWNRLFTLLAREINKNLSTIKTIESSTTITNELDRPCKANHKAFVSPRLYLARPTTKLLCRTQVEKRCAFVFDSSVT